jgi:hypothetical protein
MSLFGDIKNGIVDTIGTLQDSLDRVPLNENQRNQFRSEGFALPANYSADGNGLPYNKVPANKQGQIKRNIITWFVPEFGTVKMFINPESISYQDKKLITKTRTKGGYALQYWGEELTTLNISGTTGSSGIEGINMLYEIYRAEQYAFDSVGLTLAANNASADIAGNIVNGVGSAIGGAIGNLIGSNEESSSAVGSSLLGGLLGLDSQTNNLAARNLPTLAQLAFGVEMYYNGVVYRGFFENMTVNEKANNFPFEYQINFTVTQKRGYRVNYFPFHRSANSGPSDFDTPHSFNGRI